MKQQIKSQEGIIKMLTEELSLEKSKHNKSVFAVRSQNIGNFVRAQP
jgi:hypothetical protein